MTAETPALSVIVTAADLLAAYRRGERAFNLSGADLSWANLRGADLSGANLRGANLRGTGAAVVYGLTWSVYVYPDLMQIGCELHSHAEWAGFDDGIIARMAPGEALPFWREHGPMLLALCARAARVYAESHWAPATGDTQTEPATQTGEVAS